MVWMAFIFVGSTHILSGARTSRFVVPLLRWLMPGLSPIALDRAHLVVRKCGHVTEYAVLGVLLWRACHYFRPGDRTPWSWSHAATAVFLAALYAVGDELHQSFYASRFGSPWDVAIDAMGATVGMILLWLLGRWRKFW